MARYTDEQMKEAYKIAAKFFIMAGSYGDIGWGKLDAEELSEDTKFRYYCDYHFREIPPPPPPFAYGS